jgi:hypothetical protein
MPTPQFWNADRRRILRERYPEEGPELLAVEFGKSQNSIQLQSRKLGLHSLNKCKRQALSRAQKNHTVDIHYFDQWSPNMAYTLGYLLGDGCIRERRESGGYGVRLKCSRIDEKLLLDIRADMKSHHKVSYYEAYINNQGVNIGPQVVCAMSSYLLVQALVKLGCRENKSNCDYPLPEIPDEYLSNTARGLLDSDGCASNGVFLWLGTYRLIHDLQDRIVDAVKISPNKPCLYGGSWGIAWAARDDRFTLYDWLYPTGRYLHGERKKEELRKHLVC